MRSTVLCLTGVLGLLLGSEACRADRGGTDAQAVDAYLQEMGASGYTITPVHGPYLAKTFPDYKFFGVYFHQWPVRVPPPPELAQSNVFYVDRVTRQIGYLTSPDDLQQFFEDYWSRFVIGTTGSHFVADITKSWLSLSEQFSQDGFYQFSKPAVEVVGMTGYGSVTVISGGTGYVEVVITFSPTGGLSIDEQRNVVPGQRPI